jgi:hypothetical protein
MASAATLGMIALGASTAVSVIGSLSKASAQQAQYEYQADMARKQGELAELNARNEAAALEMDAQRLRSKQIAQGAAAGVDVTSGSILDVIAESAKNAETERQNVLRAGRLNREAYNVEAAGYSNAAKSAKRSGWISAGTSLLSGIAGGIGIADKAGWFDSATKTAASSGKSLAAIGNLEKYGAR